MTWVCLALAYYLSWAWFMGGGLLVNLLSLPLLPWRKSPRVNRASRRLVRALFRQWVFWFRASRIVRVTWRGFARPAAAARPGTVFIANHPTLVDAPVLLARLPADTVCIFKPALMRNPAIGPAAVVGGHFSGDGGIDLVRNLAEQIAGGLSLLIFPEGTRTDAGAALNPLKPGFALIANRAGAAVQLVRIRGSRGFVPRGRAWWRPPAVMPASLEFALDRAWPHDPRKTAAELSAEIEAYLRGALGREKEGGR
ncbi:MAG: 1-acyl-sn-glycerol-3-phosphate acyltransferase [Opitutaceae bacterium]|nr:1-acyl-sn-glycerol-3-phosphate acyltransferase [Opitutaceae bacterium]